MVVVGMASGAGIRRPAVVEPGRSRTVATLGPSPRPAVDVGDLTLVSAGAITQALLYVVLRLPYVRGMAQVFDDDQADMTNLNRYPLLLASDIGRPKVEQLERLSDRLLIGGIGRRYAGGSTSGARRLLIGADDIAVRWTAQRDHPQWLGVGATSHLFAVVSSHAADTPCVGCVHDHEDEVPDVIPTISVVSGWAGLVLAAELLHDLSGTKTAGRMEWSYPLGLPGRSGHRLISIPPNPKCPVPCAVSQQRLSA